MERYAINPTHVETGYIYKSKNDAGQIINLQVDSEEYDNLVYWNVVFWVGKNSRRYEYNQQTGRDGLRSLLWAKRCLVHFMTTVERNHLRQHLLVGWDNNRRKKTYERGLRDLGFRYARLERQIVLHKAL